MIGYAGDDSFNTLEIAIMAGALLLTAALFLLVYFATDSVARRQKRRLQGVRERAVGSIIKNEDGNSASAVRREDDSILDMLVKRFLPNPDNLRVRLRRTGRNITIGKFGVMIVGFGAIFGLMTSHIFGFSGMVALVVGLGAGLWLPNLIVSTMISRREDKFTGRFPEGLDVLVRGLRAGLPIAESIVNARDEVVEPVKSVFGEIADAINLGQNLEDAIKEAARMVDTPELKFFGITLTVQRETGGNLAETLSNLADILRRRRQMKLKVRAMSSEARTSAIILGSLPFVMFGLIYMANSSYVMELFTRPVGNMLLGIGLLSMGIGVFIMWKMVNFEI